MQNDARVAAFGRHFEGRQENTVRLQENAPVLRVPAKQQRPLYDPSHRFTGGSAADSAKTPMSRRMNSANRSGAAARMISNSKSQAANDFSLGVGGTGIR
mgnify:CR=1 FL=1